MLPRVSTVQMQPTKHALDDADSTARTRQRELHQYRSYRSGICLPCLADPGQAVGIDDLSVRSV